MNAQELGNRPGSRHVHRAGKVRPDGAVSAICSDPPRAINMRTSTWTTTDSAVTCARCLAILAREAQEAGDER